MPKSLQCLCLCLMLILVFWLPPGAAPAQDLTPLSFLEEYPYPYRWPFSTSARKARNCAWPIWTSSSTPGEAAKLVVSLHHNFPASYWRDTIKFLTQHGFRVVAPDQIGFGKSTKAELALQFHWRITPKSSGTWGSTRP